MDNQTYKTQINTGQAVAGGVLFIVLIAHFILFGNGE